MQGFLGSVDANTGDLLLGWDTDQFPTDIYLTTKIMLVLPQVRRLHYRRPELRRQGPPRELRADRPVLRPYRRHGRLRQGLKIAAAIRADGELDRMVKERYATWDSGLGAEIEAGKPDFASLEKYMLQKGDITPNTSGRQEMFENVVNRYVF